LAAALAILLARAREGDKRASGALWAISARTRAGLGARRLGALFLAIVAGFVVGLMAVIAGLGLWLVAIIAWLGPWLVAVIAWLVHYGLGWETAAESVETLMAASWHVDRPTGCH